MPVSRLFYNFANAYVTMVWNTEDFYCFSGGLFIALMCKEQHRCCSFCFSFGLQYLCNDVVPKQATATDMIMNSAIKNITIYKEGCIALLEIDSTLINKYVIVLSELRCIPDLLKICHRPWTSLEEIQEKLGSRLCLVKMSECDILGKKTACVYSTMYGDGKTILAFPATGEEIIFEMYTLGDKGELRFLHKMEL